MNRQSDIFLKCVKCVLLSMVMALFACGESPPAQGKNSVSNPIAVQKVQQDVVAETKNPHGSGEAKTLPQTSVAPAKESGALPSAQAKTMELPAVAPVAETSANVEANTGEPRSAEKPIEAEQTVMAGPENFAALAPAQVPTEIGLAAEPSEIKESLLVAGTYDPSGRSDPFEALFRAQSGEATVTSKSTREKRAPQTPLERVALSQLKVTAIIRSASGNRALVEDAAGKGYVVQHGTYIGLNAGRVIEIDRSRILIEEEIESIMGELTLKNAELKLQKPAGEL